ncbi:hypothetical protein JW826_06405 [Candidatus Woesearchaeota archaeon]|nr:hypothetical protein [Candidatus Woesearchaeota archaeon]
MTDFVAVLGVGKGTWTNVLKLAARPEFENVFLIMNEWTKNNLKLEKQNVHAVIIDSETSVGKIRDSIASQLKGKAKGLEVALNIDSGTGKEHTATITALMRLGLSFRFVSFEDEKIEEVSYDLHLSAEESPLD